MSHQKDVVTFADIMENLDEIPKGDPFARGKGPADPLRERSMADALSSAQLAERVRELEEAWSGAEAHGLHTEGIRDLADALGIREGKMTADGVARHALQRVRELEAERDAYARSHLILKAIHGALTDALPNTPIPALDSFDVVELVRNIVAECERMKTFAAENFSAMIRQEAEQMRAYGLSYEGVRKVLREHDDGEISFGKLMDLLRAAARAMAEDMK